MRPKLIIALLLLVPHLPFAQSSYSGDTWAEVKANKGGTISLAYVETPGFVYKDNTGSLTGVCVDIMQDFVEWVNTEKGFNLAFRYVGDGSSFRGMFDKVKSARGGVFGLGNVTITEERKRQVRFGPPFITNFAILVSQQSVPTLTKFEDISKSFANLTAYTAKGTTNEKRILDLRQKYYPGMKVSTATTSQDVIENIFADPNGFAYVDLAFYIQAVQMKKSIKRHAIGDKASEQFGLIMPLNSDWNPIVDEFFKAKGGYLNSKAYRSILIKHLGAAGVKLLQSEPKI